MRRGTVGFNVIFFFIYQFLFLGVSLRNYEQKKKKSYFNELGYFLGIFVYILIFFLILKSSNYFRIFRFR